MIIVCLWGFTPTSHIVLLSPLSLPPFQEKGGSITSGSAQVFCHESGTCCSFNDSDRVLTALDATSAPRYNFEHWDQGQFLVSWMNFPETSWKASRKETSEQTESTRDHDYTSITCIPPWVQPRPPKWCFASLSWFSSDDVFEVSVARDSRVKVVEFPFKASHSRLCRWDTSYLSILADYSGWSSASALILGVGDLCYRLGLKHSISLTY